MPDLNPSHIDNWPLDEDAMGTEIVTVFVGKMKKEVAFHKKLLSSRSTAFEKHMQVVQKKGKQSTFHCESRFENAFSVLITYLYKGYVPSGPADTSVSCNVYARQMRELYYLAERFEIMDLMDKTMDAIQNHDSQEGRLTHMYMSEIYENTSRDSKLRWYCAASAAWHFSKLNSPMDPKLKLVENYRDRAEILSDILKALLTFQGAIANATSDYRVPSEGGTPDSCTFHAHTDEAMCFRQILAKAKKDEDAMEASIGADDDIVMLTPDEVAEIQRQKIKKEQDELDKNTLKNTPHQPSKVVTVEGAIQKEIGVEGVMGKETGGHGVGVPRVDEQASTNEPVRDEARVLTKKRRLDQNHDLAPDLKKRPFVVVQVPSQPNTRSGTSVQLPIHVAPLTTLETNNQQKLRYEGPVKRFSDVNSIPVAARNIPPKANSTTVDSSVPASQRPVSVNEFKPTNISSSPSKNRQHQSTTLPAPGIPSKATVAIHNALHATGSTAASLSKNGAADQTIIKSIEAASGPPNTRSTRVRSARSFLSYRPRVFEGNTNNLKHICNNFNSQHGCDNRACRRLHACGICWGEHSAANH